MYTFLSGFGVTVFGLLALSCAVAAAPLEATLPFWPR